MVSGKKAKRSYSLAVDDLILDQNDEVALSPDLESFSSTYLGL